MSGWLESLIRSAVEAHRPEQVLVSASPEVRALKSGRARARRHLRDTLRSSGLVYGTPVGDARPPGQGPEEFLFRSVLRTFCRLALDVATLLDAPPGPRAEQVLLLFAALSNRLDDADDVHRRIERAMKTWPLPAKLWQRLEAELEGRALSLAADPYYGLVLHNGAVFVDANVFGRLALAYFSRSSFPREAAERRLRFANAQKARLVEVLIALVCAERSPGFPTRRAILRQIDDLKLPEELTESTLDFARRAFEKPVSVQRLTRGLESRDLKRFIIEQTVLASLVDGRRSPREVEWTRSLGRALGFDEAGLTAIELEMAAFYREHRNVVDVFTLSAGAEVMGEEWVDELSGKARKNYRALLKELQKAGELSVLLARAARRQTLTDVEKKRMREQLIDVAKAVPALAIFAAPGGVLLLLALIRVLPPDLLPSSFREDLEE